MNVILINMNTYIKIIIVAIINKTSLTKTLNVRLNTKSVFFLKFINYEIAFYTSKHYVNM